MGEVGCYTLDLYCDRENPAHAYKEFPHTFIAELGATCRRRAREAGWVFHKDRTASCPKCNRRKGRPCPTAETSPPAGPPSP
jgi:hypothetical protein